VVLGASLNVRALVQSTSDLELAGALIVGMLAVHVLAARLIRSPTWTGLIVTAQLGVPAAIAKLGLAQSVLRPGQAAAIIVGALASLGICAAGTSIAKRKAAGATLSAHPPPTAESAPRHDRGGQVGVR
jgi:hypothetical protein